jgi:hypothetical protein
MRSNTARSFGLALTVASLGLVSLATTRAQDQKPEKPPEKKTGFIGIQMDAVALETSPGGPPESAIRVVALVPGSPAEGAGVHPGDLVLALDDEGFKGVEVKDTVNVFRASRGASARTSSRARPARAPRGPRSCPTCARSSRRTWARS